MTGGFAPKALKKLNGERLFLPSSSSVETSAIGRGATPLSSNRWTKGTGCSFGLKLFMSVVRLRNRERSGAGLTAEISESAL
jgi:hypothetical protein